jgi:hypothetical protein
VGIAATTPQKQAWPTKERQFSRVTSRKGPGEAQLHGFKCTVTRIYSTCTVGLQRGMNKPVVLVLDSRIGYQRSGCPHLKPPQRHMSAINPLNGQEYCTAASASKMNGPVQYGRSFGGFPPENRTMELVRSFRENSKKETNKAQPWASKKRPGFLRQ